ERASCAAPTQVITPSSTAMAPSSITPSGVTRAPRTTEISAIEHTFLEEPGLDVVDAAHRVVVQDEALDPAVGRQHPGLRLDLLRGEDTGHRGEQRVPVEQVEVAGQLFDTVDVTAALDLDRHVPRRARRR